MKKYITLILKAKGATYHVMYDQEDEEKLAPWTWQIMFNRNGTPYVYGYAWDKEKKKSMRKSMSRLIMDAPKGMYVDHISHNTLDNRKSNLRLATPSQSNGNMRQRKDSPHFKGVSKTANGRYQARSWQDGRNKTLGTYDTAYEAAKAYDAYAVERFGEFAKLNFQQVSVKMTVRFGSDVPGKSSE